MPNWNSCTIPVTTPTAKLIRKIFPKNLVMRRYTSSFLTRHRVCMIATRYDRLSVSGTKMKW